MLQDKSEDKKAPSKGKKGPKGKQTEETNQEQTKDNLPAENGEAKTEEVKFGGLGLGLLLLRKFLGFFATKVS